jgi:hypothetical protein
MLYCLTFTFYAQVNQEKFKKYPFKSAIVEYNISGTYTGTKTLYVDDYGYKEANKEETIMKFMGAIEKAHKAVIMIGSEHIEINYLHKTATKNNNPTHQYYAENVGKNYIEVGEKTLQKMGFTKVGKEMVRGKLCDKWKGSINLWTWKGLTLKTETKLMGVHIVEEAVSVKIDEAVEASVFEIPEDMKIISKPSVFDGLQDFYDENLAGNSELKEILKLSFEEWKKKVKKEDPDIADWTDQELKEEYEFLREIASKLKSKKE